eukprot:5738838-Pleurochrysis_carterae.AAC.1
MPMFYLCTAAIPVRGPRTRPPNTTTRSTQIINQYDNVVFNLDQTKWYASHHTLDMETHETVRMDIGASISSHSRYISKQSAQEPFVTLRGLSESGVRRNFRSWPQKPAPQTQGAVVWEASSPEKLYELMGESPCHKYSAGCVKLHVKMGALIGYKILIVQPPFRAWFKRAASSRTTLLIEFKLLVMHERGQLDLPPSCHYPDAELQRSKKISVKALKQMRTACFPLSPGLLKLAGEPEGSRAMNFALARQREKRAKAMGAAKKSVTGKKRALAVKETPRWKRKRRERRRRLQSAVRGGQSEDAKWWR